MALTAAAAVNRLAGRKLSPSPRLASTKANTKTVMKVSRTIEQLPEE
jgi:hypothetical protein